MSSEIEENIFYTGNNANPSYTNPKFINIVVGQIESNLKRELTSMEVRMATNFIRKLDPNILLNMPYHRVLEGVTKSIVKKLAFDCTTKFIDMHETLKQKIGISRETNFGRSLTDQEPSRSKKEQKKVKAADAAGASSVVDVARLFGYRESFHLQKLLNPNALLRTNYVMMDTRYRVLDSDGRKFFSWNHINNVSRNQGSINTIGTIRDIVALRIYPFRIPYNSSLDTRYKKISMLIREFQAQSFVGQEQRRFHFLFNPIIDGDSVFLEPGDNNDGYYRFGQPITQFDTITIDFGSPLEPIEFDADRLNGEVTLYGDGIETHFTTSSPHNLITGHNVYISDFSSLDNLSTSIITQSINSSKGHNVIVVSPTVFKIQVDTNNITSLIEGGLAAVLNGNQVTGLTIPINTTLNTGDRIRITDAASAPFGVDEVFNVKFYDPVAGTIYLNETYAGPLAPIWVWKDFRPPPLTTTNSVSVVEPESGITVTGAIATGGKSFLNDYKVGDPINFINVETAIDDGPHTVLSIKNDNELLTDRAALTTLNNMTALKSTQLESNIFQIYFGSKRIFIPMEITFISPEL